MPTRPRWRSPRFPLKVLLANVLCLSILFVLGEVAVRVWRERGLGAGLRSFADGGPIRRAPGTDRWLVPDEERGYTLNPERPEFSSLRVRHAELAEPKPVDAFRILHIGDSVSWDEDGFVTTLARDLGSHGSGGIEVINAAVPGYTIYQERRTLERLIVPVDPDLVILQYCLNDNHRFLHRLTEDGGWLFTQESRSLLVADGDGLVDRFSRWSYLALEIRRTLFKLQHSERGLFPWEGRADFHAAWDDGSWDFVAAELQLMVACVRATGIPLFVVAVPYEPQLRDAPLEKDHAYTLKPQTRLGDLCRARHVPFLDLHPAFLAHRQDGLFRDGVHLTAAGHALAAREIRSRLVADGLLR